MNEHQNLIGGRWRGGHFAPNHNPSDLGSPVGLYARATAEDTAEAIAAARSAFPAWAAMPPLQRHAILRRAADEIAARAVELGRLLSSEEGKTLAEGIGEATRAGQIFDFHAGEVLRQLGELRPSLRPGVGIEVTREPLGVVGLITPWNFPIAIPAWKLAPALAHGNCVVMKPADLAPGSAWALVEILHRAGLPPGVLNLVMGAGSVVGQAMIDSPELDAISFTGSTATGRRVAEASARHLRRVQLEMGGKNPLVVLEDADLDLAVDCAVQGAFFSTGQRCTASSRLIVTEPIHDRFVAALSARMQALNVGHALGQGVQIGPVVDQTQLEQNERYLQIGRAEGANLIGGHRLDRATDGHFMAPALFTEVQSSMRIAREEIFGPVAAVIRVKDYDAALEVANDTEYGLSAGIVTQSLARATHFKRAAQAGMVMVNLPTAGVDFHVPFGGRKASSLGPREQGRAEEFFTTVKTAYTSAGLP